MYTSSSPPLSCSRYLPKSLSCSCARWHPGAESYTANVVLTGRTAIFFLSHSVPVCMYVHSLTHTILCTHTSARTHPHAHTRAKKIQGSGMCNCSRSTTYH